MNLRKRDLFKVEEIRQQMKKASHAKQRSNMRKKLKNPQEIGVMIHRVHASNDSVYEAAEDLVLSRRQYHEIKIKLRRLLAEKEQIRENIYHRKDNLQKVTNELHNAIVDLKTVRLNEMSEHEAAVVSLNSWLVEEDIIEAWKHIRLADQDLKEDPYRMKRSKKAVCRTLNSVSIPNVLSNGVVSLNGSINISRNKCCICLERRVNAVLYKCGHFCMCFDCATELTNLSQSKVCPVCRTDVVDVIKTYLA